MTLRATAIVPVKPWALSKSRLSVPESARRRLARAFALDVLEVVRRSSLIEQIVIVSAEPEMQFHGDKRAVVLADRPLMSPDMMEVSIDTGRWWAQARWPSNGVVIVPSDVPCITPEVLDETIERLSVHDVACVPDLAGSGTTLRWARSPSAIRRGASVRVEAREIWTMAHALAAAHHRARCRVVTREDLTHALWLGAGPQTSEVVHEFHLAHNPSRGH